MQEMIRAEAVLVFLTRHSPRSQLASINHDRSAPDGRRLRTISDQFRATGSARSDPLGAKELKPHLSITEKADDFPLLNLELHCSDERNPEAIWYEAQHLL